MKGLFDNIRVSLGFSSEANSATGDTLSLSGWFVAMSLFSELGDNHGASNDAVGTREVDIGGHVKGSTTMLVSDDIVELAWGGCWDVTFTVAGLADEGVEDSASGVATVSQVAESVDVELVSAVAEAIDVSPDISALIFTSLLETDNTADGNLILGVQKHALGVNSAVGSVVDVSASDDFVAIVANERLGLAGFHEDSVTLTLSPAVGGEEFCSVSVNISRS